MLFRRATLGDYEKIVELQNKNLISNLHESDLASGFLATAFTAEQFAVMNQTMCVAICEDAGRLCGYLGSGGIDFYQQFSVAAAMLHRLSAVIYRGQSVDQSRLFVANPVCIDEEYRGHGIYQGLCSELQAYLPQSCDLAITMVADANKRSLTATTRLGFEAVDYFEANGQWFHTMINDLGEFRQKMEIPRR